jgi:alkylhydroperoxidase family enzyme
VSPTQIAALERGEVLAGLFSEREHAALAFADQILDGPRVADDTFAPMHEQFSPREVVELLLTMGYFRMIGSLVTTLDIESDPVWAVNRLDGAKEALEVSQ